jgi:hypothetical protein
MKFIFWLLTVVSFIKAARFIQVNGKNLVSPDGSKFFIRGVNLGHWLNPEGYMFNFDRTASPHMIDEAFRELVGPDFTNEFWKKFKDNFVTKADIVYLKSLGCNTLRVPFHYKLFTNEDYLGLTFNQDGFERLDLLVEWAREAGLYLILDMHDAPGGQTGHNIDDSYGYPWLYVSETSQKLYNQLWTEIANHYKDEEVVLGYELLNEPVPDYFNEFFPNLEPTYRAALAAIRTVDKEHVVIFGGGQWNYNFSMLSTNASFDSQVMYTAHVYQGTPGINRLQHIIDFRDQVNRPMLMGELGHNTNDWYHQFVVLMEDNNIGWTFWTFKRMDGSAFLGYSVPKNWDAIIKFVDGQRGSYDEIRAARPSQDNAKQALNDYVEYAKLTHCTLDQGYINAIGLKVPN